MHNIILVYRSQRPSTFVFVNHKRRCAPQVIYEKKKPPMRFPQVRSFRIKTNDGYVYLNHSPMGAMVKTFYDMHEKGLLVRARALTGL